MKACCEVCGKTDLNIRDNAPKWGIVVCSDICKYIRIGFEMTHCDENLDTEGFAEWLKLKINWRQ